MASEPSRWEPQYTCKTCYEYRRKARQAKRKTPGTAGAGIVWRKQMLMRVQRDARLLAEPRHHVDVGAVERGVEGIRDASFG